MGKEDIKKAKNVAISRIKESDSFILSAEGTAVVVGNGIDVMTNIVFLMNNLLEKLPQKIKKKILATLISTLRNEEEISNEDEELAQKVLDKIKELK